MPAQETRAVTRVITQDFILVIIAVQGMRKPLFKGGNDTLPVYVPDFSHDNKNRGG